MTKVGSFSDHSWDRFLVDFGAIFAPSWEPKWNQNRYKRGLEKWWKNDDDQDGDKIGYRRLRLRAAALSRAQGRYSLKGGLNPSRSPWHGTRHRLAIKSYLFFQWFFQHHLISILSPFWLPTSSQNRSPIHQKSIPRAIWETSNFVHWLLIEFQWISVSSQPHF